jgi:hypothetical protein
MIRKLVQRFLRLTRSDEARGGEADPKCDGPSHLNSPIFDDSPRCPYCNAALPKRPQRKTRCRACGQFIYVRRRPGRENRELVTKAQLAEIEAHWAAWNEQHYGPGEQRRYFPRLSGLGIAGETYAAVRDALAPHTHPDSLDWSVAWTLANETAARTESLHERKLALWILVGLLEEKGLEFGQYAAKAYEAELLGYMPGWQTGSVVGIKLRLHASDSELACPACRAVDGRVLTLEQALEERPIPPLGCICERPGGRRGLSYLSYWPVLRGDRWEVPR